MNTDKTAICGFKLTNGLDLIAKIGGEDDKTIHLEDAFFLQVQTQQNGDLNVEYVPLTVLGRPTGKSHMGFDVNLPVNSVLFQFELNPGIVDKYLSYVEPPSPLILPNKELITP